MTFRATGFSGIISLLYGILLHGGNPTRGSTATPPELPEHTLNVVTAGIKMLSNIAVLDLEMMQVIKPQTSYKISRLDGPVGFVQPCFRMPV